MTDNQTVETRRDKLPECTHPRRPVLLAEHSTTGAMKIIYGLCGMWQCDRCGRENAIAWGKKLAYGVQTYGGAWHMITVTAHRRERGQDASIANIRRGWDLMRKRVHKAKLTGHYARVWERHADGSFHNHILTDIPIPTKTSKRTGWIYSPMLRLMAVQCGMGYQCDIRPLDDATGAIWYTAKYLVKQVGDDDWPAGIRRIQTSQNWPVMPGADYDDPWQWSRITDATADDLYAYHKRAGDDIRDYRKKDENPDHKLSGHVPIGPL